MALDALPAMENVLCITVDNSPLVGTFLGDVGLQSADVLSQPQLAPK
jgi:hypothetical protein